MNITEQEIWKPIKGYEEKYEISNFGRVKSLRLVRNTNNKFYCKKRDLILAQNLSNNYLFVNLYKNKEQKEMYRIHHLVWDHFGDRPRNKTLLIDHIDGDRSNNKRENLQLLTSRQNISKGFLQKGKLSRFTGVSYKKKGQKHWASRIQINHKTFCLGNFRTETEAGLAYEKAKIQFGIMKDVA